MRARSIAIIGLLTAFPLFATEPTQEQTAFFENKIRPIFANNCYKCHSIEQGKSKGGLTLDSRDGWMQGGEDGAVIVPGDLAKSMLIQAVSYTDADLQMPPKDKKLSDQDIAALTEWVKMGAPDPRVTKPVVNYALSGLTDKARAHWAFQPLEKCVAPTVKNKAWGATPVDRFILAKLEEHNMVPSPQASREALIRRAYYDLIGLPPSPGEVQRFIEDRSPNAFAKIVDHLLASPQYGERWGRHWLDTARYGDTQGGDGNADRDIDYRYANAWTYRDYVIDSFNQDKPYNEFLVEQIAADKLPNAEQDKTKLAALGFLTVGQRFTSNNDVINDRIDVVSKGCLGLTVSCARCHDHKFDPIPTTDYYALHGVFASTVEPQEKPEISRPNLAQFLDFQQKLVALNAQNRKIYYDAIDKWLTKFHASVTGHLFAAYQRQRKGNAEALKAMAEVMKKDQLNPLFVGIVQGRLKRNDPVFGPLKIFADINESDFAASSDALLAKITDERRQQAVNPLVVAAFKESPVPASMDDVLAVYAKVFAGVEAQTKPYLAACAAAQDKPVEGFDPATAQLIEAPFRVMPASDATRPNLHRLYRSVGALFAKTIPFIFPKINELEMTHPGAPARAMSVADALKPQDSRVFIRGQAQVKGEVVPRHFLEILSPNRKPEPFKDGSGRLELARDIASPDNPLTARVMVNRVWMYHFGEGFVSTPDNLGTQSEPPSHPELLDYLANYFVQNGWSIKKLHRLIMLSKVYQESSRTTPAYEQLDPENRLLWRANIRRLDFESLRDSLLTFSGKLDLSMGGPPINLTDEPYSYRRSVYGYIDRGNLPELMQEFDFSDPAMTNSKRTSTIVPQQALFLMNSPMAVDVARRLVARAEFASAGNDQQRVFQLYRIILQRAPRPPEIQLGLQFIAGEIANQPPQDSVTAERQVDDKKARPVRKNNGRRAAALRPIQNNGDFVERKRLTPWETYAQALLFSNEASYVN